MHWLIFLVLSPWLALAEPVHGPHVLVDLVASTKTVQPGQSTWIGLRFEHEPHWHTYWQNPGDSGLPTKVKWTLPAGWQVRETNWALPKRILLPPLVNFGYDGESMIAFRVDVPANASGSASIEGDASFLVCKEECIPGKAHVQLTLPVSKETPAPGPLAGEFAKLQRENPVPLPPGAFQAVKIEGKRIGIQLDDDPSWIRGRSIDFFPLETQTVKGDAPPKAEGRAGDLTLWMEKSEPFSATAKNLRGVIVLDDKGRRESFLVDAPLVAGAGAGTAAAAKDVAKDEGGGVPAVNPPAVPSLPATPPTSAAAAPAETPELLLAAVLAFLGGALLNLMPCVFPVLGIKVMALVSQKDGDRWHARKHGKVYTLGVLLSFWALTAVLLGLRSAGQAVGWGFQLQQPEFVLVLIFLFTLIAANLMGAFEFGGRWMGLGSGLAQREGYAGSLFTGILAVVVATPCTAPFMGTAIGVVLGQPAWAVFVVFTFLGLGLAFPFLLLSYQPSLLRRLPRPGRWMELLKEFFAFPMAATVLWLLWVLGQQRGLDATVLAAGAVILLCGGFWAWHRFPGRGAHIGAGLMFALSIATAVGVSRLPPVTTAHAAEGGWAPYSEAALNEALAAGNPVFVDFTAAWCLTCQVNKAAVLDTASMQAFFREKGVVLLLGDWTNSDPAITAALEKQGRIGVPLYLAYRPGGGPPAVLPQILTEARLREAFP